LEEANIVVIGAGIVGMAVAAKISEENEGVLILEKDAKYGQETSTHNSSVVHSGIHYPRGSLKAHLCVKGNTMVYETCEKYGLPYKKLGKLTVAITDGEIAELEKLMKQGLDNGVDGLKFLDGEAVRSLEPNVKVERALYSPSTGIIEPDELMAHYYAEASRNGAVLSTNTEVTSLGRVKDTYEIGGISLGEEFTIRARTVINCAGLHADSIVGMLGIDLDKHGYRQHPCKGDYFRAVGRPPVKMLVYPVPEGPGLGVHLTPDLGGTVRLGPNAYYVDDIDYRVGSDEKEFREDVERFMPSIRGYELVADFAGIRPKLQGPSDGFRDFVIRDEADKGFPGFINLVGIESPGLTSAQAIAELVNEIHRSEVKR
jgi:L-2-hydroxyglutarate oxidase LhgO